MLLNQSAGAFTPTRSWKTGRELAFGLLNCVGRHTVTGILTASGQQFVDWSSAYRLFRRQRVDITKLFEVVQSGVLSELENQQMIVAHMDDTILKKSGRHIPGATWRRDPLGPHFQTNLIWGQRFIQISMALPEENECCRARAIPVDFFHCPTVKRPQRKAEQQQWVAYKEQQRKVKLSKQGSSRLKQLRCSLDAQGAGEKQLVISVDGSYTNQEVLKNLPERVTLIGRIRKDTKLYLPPEDQPEVGRKRIYGYRLPTPEQIRKSEAYPWEEVTAYAAGRTHTFKVKVLKNVLWRSAGQQHNLQLVIIKPLGYRLTKSSPVIYRQEAYLICTDNDLNIKTLLQNYLWRWEIEVNFREEKTTLGCGEAQVRNPESAERVPAFISAVYALLNLAAHRVSKKSGNVMLPRPKWYEKKDDKRYTTGDIINCLRAQVWAKSIQSSFSGFVEQQIQLRSLQKLANPITSAMFYSRN